MNITNVQRSQESIYVWNTPFILNGIRADREEIPIIHLLHLIAARNVRDVKQRKTIHKERRLKLLGRQICGQFSRWALAVNRNKLYCNHPRPNIPE